MLYRLLINYPIYGHLLPIKEEHIRKTFSRDWSIVYQVVSEHISDHIVICERIIVLV